MPIRASDRIISVCFPATLSSEIDDVGAGAPGHGLRLPAGGGGLAGGSGAAASPARLGAKRGLSPAGPGAGGPSHWCAPPPPPFDSCPRAQHHATRTACMYLNSHVRSRITALSAVNYLQAACGRKARHFRPAAVGVQGRALPILCHRGEQIMGRSPAFWRPELAHPPIARTGTSQRRSCVRMCPPSKAIAALRAVAGGGRAGVIAGIWSQHTT